MTGIVNALTIDVEDYFQVSAFSAHIAREDWDTLPCRVEANVDRILELLAEHDARATFFTLGWIAERFPGMIHRIVGGGHELASHGYDHVRASEQAYGQFLADIRLAKAVLEDVAGHEVKGYRAPSFSIGVKNNWAFDCLVEAGYRYSSSIYPIRHDHYGVPDSPRFPHEVAPTGPSRSRSPPSAASTRTGRPGAAAISGCCPTACRGGRSGASTTGTDSPPCSTSTRGRSIQSNLASADPGRKAMFRHYLNLTRMQSRLSRLLSDFRWDRVDRAFPEILAAPRQPRSWNRLIPRL